ncbi:hypothetical protein F5Y18DRAFT_429119 [Xylariaceae sp. FL1019]|nr:hypothetical protein F5Y18DRAFT_429119 [Xylariaceae sp. FL1019]
MNPSLWADRQPVSASSGQKSNDSRIDSRTKRKLEPIGQENVSTSHSLAARLSHRTRIKPGRARPRLRRQDGNRNGAVRESANSPITSALIAFCTAYLECIQAGVQAYRTFRERGRTYLMLNSAY